MSSFEAKKDYTADVQALIPESVTVANEKGIDEAIVLLLALEKKCRLGNDSVNLKEVCLQMVRLCKEKTNWIKLNSVLAVINKRDGLNKSVISSVVAEAESYIESLPNVDTKIELIKALKEVCDGKIYVEGESAKFHFMLSKIYENRGDIDAACDIIQDVHVETYGSLSKKEKAEYILEQMRVTLVKKDYIRALIHSRKMNTKTLEEDGFAAIKIRYYTMMIQYQSVERNSWEICQAYYKIATSTTVPVASADADMAVDVDPADAAADLARRQHALESCILFLLMSKFDNHQSDMMHRVKGQLLTTFKTVPLDALYGTALALFTTHEIIRSPFAGQAALEAHSSLHRTDHQSDETAEFFRQQLRDRVVQHNLRVVARYYQRIRSARLAALLDLPYDTLETHLSEIASGGDLYLKIDRPAGIVSFHQPLNPEQVLTEWSSDVAKMLHLMEATCHIINRENMVYKV